MTAAWSLLGLRRRRDRPEVVVIGTDPAFGLFAARVLRFLRRDLKVAHWCYDLYPEVPIAEGLLREGSWAARLLKRLMRSAYGACDLVADLGPCMRERLEPYGHRARKATLVPWALCEPPAPLVEDPSVRKELFGDAALGLLYSGSFGRAHSHEELLDLARSLRGESIRFCFSVRGNREAALRAAIRPGDANIRFAPFAPEDELERRLGAADIHLVSLRPDYTGLVVPSKFFGALAAGRPVVFCGSRSSSLARWTEEHGVGWVLDRASLPSVAGELRRLARATHELGELRARCHRVYQEHFSRRKTLDEWDRELRSLLAGGADR
jgi:glycosyltransferase involved in cell wall biosynthesis